MQQSLLLTIGMVLIASSGEYFRPGSVFLSLAHVNFQPVYAYIAAVIGGCLVIHHQRQAEPVRDKG